MPNKFMENYFEHLNTDCKINILKNVEFCSKIKFSTDELIKTNKTITRIIEKPIWDKQKVDWLYNCETNFICGECNRSIFFDDINYQEDMISKIKLDKSIKKCKSCKEVLLCNKCIYKEEGDWRGMCNSCIWFDLG